MFEIAQFGHESLLFFLLLSIPVSVLRSSLYLHPKRVSLVSHPVTSRIVPEVLSFLQLHLKLTSGYSQIVSFTSVHFRRESLVCIHFGSDLTLIKQEQHSSSFAYQHPSPIHLLDLPDTAAQILLEPHHRSQSTHSHQI